MLPFGSRVQRKFSFWTKSSAKPFETK